MAENYVMWRAGLRYKALYAGRLHSGLLLLWLGTAALVALTWPTTYSHPGMILRKPNHRTWAGR